MTSGSSRRDFLKTAGVAGGLLVTGALFGTPGAQAAGRALGGPAAPADPWDQVPVILARIVPPTFPNKTFNILDYGAKGDGKADCTKAFKDAIAACNAAGGGRVLVPASGTYKTGAIHFLSNVELNVAAGATVKFKTDAASYPLVSTRWQGIECMNFSPFIYAYGQTNVAITGGGTLDGDAKNGPWFGYDDKRGPDWDKLQQQAVDGVPVAERKYGNGHYLKPNMIQFYKCKNILISDVSIKNPAMWTIHPVLSQNVTVKNVKVYSRGAMVDGCDPESCSDVHITGCDFDTGDDGTVIKSGRDTDGRRVGVPSENIVIENNDYYGRWGAITIGSEMSGGVRNVFAQDNRIHIGSSYKSFYGVYIKTNKRRGGIIDGIYVRRLSGGPCDRGGVYVDMNYSLTGPGFGAIVHPKVRNIFLSDIKLDDSPFAVKINGSADSPLETFHATDCVFTKIDTAKPSISNAKDVVFTNVKVNGKPV
ncbi:glycosyl hydrolase family 28 protein [Amycolatopsis sp. cg5]|uniref:glycosyl hydrolase family 28 protein n=1 Tax=Amycolatopsis sp. cg5 TaxID=3238802 RepID=UPI003525E44C